MEFVDGVNSFSDFVKGLDPLTKQYEQAIEDWVKAGEVRESMKT